jgi:hypothetical protein
VCSWISLFLYLSLNAECHPRNIYAVSMYVPRTRKEDEVASTVAASVGEEKKRVL